MSPDEKWLLLLVRHKNPGKAPSQQIKSTQEKEFVHFASENLAGNSEAVTEKKQNNAEESAKQGERNNKENKK